jgi:hypothetical protein
LQYGILSLAMDLLPAGSSAIVGTQAPANRHPHKRLH